MSARYDYAFYPIGSTEPSFEKVLSTASSATILETTGREWAGPTGRSIRVSETSGVDFRVQFGSSLAVAVSSASMLALGGVVELFFVPAGYTYVAIMTPPTQISTVNLTLGYGR